MKGRDVTAENFSEYAAKEQLTVADVYRLLRLRGLPGKQDQPIPFGDGDPYAIYFITSEGIRMAPVSDRELGLLDHTHRQTLLDSREQDRLDFPCAPTALVIWVDQHSDEFVLPDSFVEPVRLKEQGHQASISAVKKNCENWLSTLIKKGPPLNTKEGYELEARKKFGIKKLSKRGFLDAWREAIAQSGLDGKTWSKPGRKRKNKS